MPTEASSRHANKRFHIDDTNPFLRKSSLQGTDASGVNGITLYELVKGEYIAHADTDMLAIGRADWAGGGHGLFSKADIREGQLLCIFSGEYIAGPIAHATLTGYGGSMKMAMGFAGKAAPSGRGSSDSMLFSTLINAEEGVVKPRKGVAPLPDIPTISYFKGGAKKDPAGSYVYIKASTVLCAPTIVPRCAYSLNAKDVAIAAPPTGNDIVPLDVAAFINHNGDGRNNVIFGSAFIECPPVGSEVRELRPIVVVQALMGIKAGTELVADYGYNPGDHTAANAHDGGSNWSAIDCRLGRVSDLLFKRFVIYTARGYKIDRYFRGINGHLWDPKRVSGPPVVTKRYGASENFIGIQWTAVHDTSTLTEYAVVNGQSTVKDRAAAIQRVKTGEPLSKNQLIGLVGVNRTGAFGVHNFIVVDGHKYVPTTLIDPGGCDIRVLKTQLYSEADVKARVYGAVTADQLETPASLSLPLPVHGGLPLPPPLPHHSGSIACAYYKHFHGYPSHAHDSLHTHSGSSVSVH
jgi:hypothetical protein